MPAQTGPQTSPQRTPQAAPRIAAQMYTLRDHCETPAAIAESCRRLRDIGYTAIQAAAAGFSTISAAELKAILDDLGMTCVATHRDLEQLENPDAEIAYHQTLGCRHACIGGWGWRGDETQNEWEAFIDRFGALAARYEGSPLKIGYHNHSHELAPFGLKDHPERISPASNPMAVLEQKLGPSAFFEIDTYWIAHGGGDPAAWLRRLAGRVPSVHLKDLTVTPQREQKMCEVGAGNLNWPEILRAAQDAGAEYFIVERDDGDLDPFESLAISLRNLKSWGFS